MAGVDKPAHERLAATVKEDARFADARCASALMEGVLLTAAIHSRPGSLASQHVQLHIFRRKLQVGRWALDRAIRILQACGYVQHLVYLGVGLTPSGWDAVKRIKRQRHVLVRYFSETLKRPQSRVASELPQLLSSLPPGIMSAIARRVGYTLADITPFPVGAPMSRCESSNEQLTGCGSTAAG